MKKIATTFLSFLVAFCCFGQAPKVRIHLNAQFTRTIYDRTIGNNPWALGLGVQGDLVNKSKFNPTFDLTADIYFADDKVQVVNSDGTSPEDLGGVVNLFAGLSYSGRGKVYYSFVLGPSYSNGKVFLGIKPSIAFYFSESQKLAGKLSFINIFDRDRLTGQDFGSLSFTLGFRLY